MIKRANWGAIVAGSVVGLGLSIVIAYLFRALGLISYDYSAVPAVNNMRSPVNGFGDAVFSILAVSLAFSAAGAATAILGRFTFALQALLHSLASLGLSYLFIHFFTRDAMFFGRAGFPFDIAFWKASANAITVPPTAAASWTICLSSLAGLLACEFATLLAYRMQQRGILDRLLEERGDLRRAA